MSGKTFRMATMFVFPDLRGAENPCECGHAKESHEGHTHTDGTPEPSHCSQRCGCKEYRQRKVER